MKAEHIIEALTATARVFEGANQDVCDALRGVVARAGRFEAQESILQNIPESSAPLPPESLAKCRILKSPYGGIMPDQIGYIVSEIPGEGFAVDVEESFTAQFGGDSKTRRGVKFFTPDQIQKL